MEDAQPVERGLPAPRGRLVVGAVLLALLSGLAGGLIANALEGGSTSTTPPPSAAVCNVTKIAADDLPSVVTITAEGNGGGGTGSGEVIRADGYVLTNNHVVSPAAPGGSLSVLFSDGRSAPAPASSSVGVRP